MATSQPLTPSPEPASRVRNGRVGGVDLVEHLVAGHVPDRPALHAGGLEVDDERGDPLVFGPASDGGRVGAEQEQSPLGQVGRRDPDLLSVHHVMVTVEDGQGAQVGQVVAGIWLGEPLAPVIIGIDDGRGSQRFFCSSVPHWMSMGPICQMPLVLNIPGAP